MNPLEQFTAWLARPTTWEGPDSVPVRVAEHLQYSGLTLALACLIAVPIGLFVGHTGKGRVLIVSLAGMLRALPTLGMVTLFALTFKFGLMPPIWALVLLAVPPILSGTYAGIAAVSGGVVDGARSLGMTELQILFQVEIPNGLPVIFGGFRAATLQVIATVTVLAVLDLGGLGRYLMLGTAVRDYGLLLGSALSIALLAILVDAALAVLQKAVVSPGLQSDPRGKP